MVSLTEPSLSTQPAPPAKAARRVRFRLFSTVRARLLALVVAAVMPVFAFSVAMVVRYADAERDALAARGLQMARATTNAIDRELAAAQSAVLGLTASRNLAEGDFAAFRRQCLEILARLPSADGAAQPRRWILLHDADGRQLVQTLPAPPSGRAPVRVDRPELARVVATAQPSISGVRFSDTVGRWVVFVDVPVFSPEQAPDTGSVPAGGAVRRPVRYVLTLALDTEGFGPLLTTEQQMPPDWISAIFDRVGLTVARTHAPGRYVGQPGSPDLVARIAAAGEGIFPNVTREGLPVYNAFSRSAVAGWSVAIGIPQEAFDAPLRQSLLLTGGAGLALLALAVLFASAVGRTIARPVQSLAPAAEALGRGDPPGIAPVGIREVEAVGRALGDAHDLLERRRMDLQRAAIDAEAATERLRAALVASGSGTFRWDIRTNALEWDEALDRLFGLPPGETARSLAQFVSLVHPDDRAGVVARCERCAADGADFDMEFRVVWPDGTERWLLDQGKTYRDAGGRPAYMTGACVDITRRKEVEAAVRSGQERFRTLAETLPQLVWTALPDGRCDYVSPQWVAYTGMTESAQLEFAWLDAAIHPDDRDRTYEHWAGAVAGRHPYDIDYRIRRHDGVYRWFKTRGTPVRDEETGRILYWFGTCTDIQDAIEAREALARSREELERRVAERTRRLEAEMAEREAAEAALHQAQKMEAVGQLVGGVAHDFNNLLTIISGNLDLLEGRLEHDPRLLKHIRTAAGAASRAGVLTGQLLAFSRRQELRPQEIDLNQTVLGMQDMLRQTVGSGIDLRFTLAPDLWPATADRNQLEVALLNLVVNARDAMPAGGCITVETANVMLDAEAARGLHPDLTPGPYIQIRVGDTGCGMTPEVLRRVFEPFFSTKGVGKGTGLGLSMVFGFVRQSRGHVRIESEPDRGTTVILHLPRAAAADRHEDEAAIRSAWPAARRVGTGSETVLVVEDDPNVREFAVSVLERLGYRVLTAADGEAGLATLAAHPEIDALFTDVVMPGTLNGLDLARAARERRPDLPILLTTAYAERLIEREGLPARVDLLKKPYRPVDLAERIEALVAPPE